MFPKNAPAASMEPRSEERGMQKWCRGWKLSKNCFNGATFRRTWNDTLNVAMRFTKEVASMEPRSEERGMSSPQRSLMSVPPRFNGATFRRTWNGAAHSTKKANHLQASMEPRSEERGMGVEILHPVEAAFLLQWSHVPKNVECRKTTFLFN